MGNSKAPSTIFITQHSPNVAHVISGKNIEVVLMNLRTPFDMFVLTLHTNCEAHNEYNKDYTFETFYGLLISDQHRLLGEGNLGGKQQVLFL
jgi:hypothetical protein